VEELIAAGININVTLIFALSTYEAVAEAYLMGLERLVAAGGNPSHVASVASFFVSRVDAAVDEAVGRLDHGDLAGTIAISNAKIAYARFADLFSGDRWEALEAAGSTPQRLLWASTGTKSPAYPDTLYIDSLIGAGTVNTVPPATLDFFLDHGVAAPTLGAEVDAARRRLDRLAELGIDLDGITDRLQREGVDAFARSFDTLLAAVTDKRERLKTGEMRVEATLGAYLDTVETALAEVRDEAVLRRIWLHDHTVWRPSPDEISNRLGWLHAPEMMAGQIERLHRFAESVRADGLRHVVLLGMGGSSLAPEAFHEIFGRPAGAGAAALELRVIDSTDPDLIEARAGDLDPAEALYIVASKSGGTVETLSAFKHFFNMAAGRLGRSAAGHGFVAITDPGSRLEELARAYGFRDVFLNDPAVGGRYSALTWFGLVPAVLAGVDVGLLLDRAQTAACNAASANCPVAGDNDAARLGVILGELSAQGRDKLTISTAAGLESFGDWIEQLVAESTGKEGRGILPVVGEPLGDPDVYGPDRLFVDIGLAGDADREAKLEALSAAGHPVVRIHLRDRYDLGSQIFTWEMATAIAGSRMGINPFDQPNVEAAKTQARELVARYVETGSLPAEQEGAPGPDALLALIEERDPRAYVALHVYAAQTPETDGALAELRTRIRDRFLVATTVGYGPRFLHSTGQLHKGDGGRGLFVQLVSESGRDIPIPDRAGDDESSMSFQVLKEAQALGDALALREAGRRVLSFEVGTDVLQGLEELTAAVS
jgi:transaldolase/glucose-6-phosphate isomerase